MFRNIDRIFIWNRFVGLHTCYSNVVRMHTVIITEFKLRFRSEKQKKNQNNTILLAGSMHSMFIYTWMTWMKTKKRKRVKSRERVKWTFRSTLRFCSFSIGEVNCFSSFTEFFRFLLFTRFGASEET